MNEVDFVIVCHPLLSEPTQGQNRAPLFVPEEEASSQACWQA